jgi:hypothetical protein
MFVPAAILSQPKGVRTSADSSNNAGTTGLRPVIGSARRTIHAERLSGSLGPPAEKSYQFRTTRALCMHWAAKREIRKPVPGQCRSGHRGFGNGNHPYYGFHVFATPTSNCIGRKSIRLEGQTSNMQQRDPGQQKTKLFVNGNVIHIEWITEKEARAVKVRKGPHGAANG